MTGTEGGAAAGSGARYYDRLERLVGRSLSGDRESFAALYDETAPRVLGLVTRVLGPGELAQDVTAQVYESVWTHQEEAPCGAGLPWLMDLARRTALTHQRSRVVPRQRALTVPSGQPPKRPFPPHPRWMPQLRPQEREALHLVYLQGATAVEADERLGWVPGTTVITLREAMLHLAELQNGTPAVAGS